MIRKPAWVLAMVAAVGTISLGAGCERPKPTVTLRVDADLMAKVEQRGQALMTRPDVERAVDGFIEGVFGEPTLLASAATLAGELAADPTLSAGLQRLMARLSAEPAIGEVVTELMQAHPDWTPDQIGDATGERMMAGYQPHSDMVGAAIVKALGGVTTTPAWTRFQARVTDPLASKLSAFLGTPARERKWSARLRELAGGKTPDPRAAAELYVEHAWSEDRMAGFVKEFLVDPGVREATVTLVRGVLAEPEVRKAVVTACSNLLAAPTMDDRLLAAFRLFLQGHATTAEAAARIEALFDPATRAELSQLIAVVLDQPTVQMLVQQAIDEVGDRAPVRAAVDRLLDNW